MNKNLAKCSQCCVFIVILSCIVGCARGEEFMVVPQKGAKQTDSYPQFTTRTKTTTQLSPAEEEALVKELEASLRQLVEQQNGE